MASLINLPGYEIPRNALLDTSGLNNAIDSNRKNALMQSQLGLQQEAGQRAERQVGLQEAAGQREADANKRKIASDEATMAWRLLDHIDSLPEEQRPGAYGVARMSVPGFKDLGPEYDDYAFANKSIRTKAAPLVDTVAMAQNRADLEAKRTNTAHVAGTERRANEMQPFDVEAKKKTLDSSKYITVAPGATVYNTNSGQPVLTTAPKMDSTDKRNLYSAQDELPALQGTIDTLKEALDLNEKAYSGVGATTGGYIGSKLPGPGLIWNEDRAKATSRYEQIMSQQAIESMSRTLKGATTDKEMSKFLSIIADTGQPPDIRRKAIQNLLTITERHQKTKTDRIQELGGKVPDFAGGNRAASPSPETTGSSGAVKQIKSDAEYDQLQPGERYMDPTGRFRTKQ